MAQARETAVDILLKIEKDKAYSSFSVADTLKNTVIEDSRELALAVSLVYGVLEHKITLDYNLSLYLSSPLKKLRPTVLAVLRTGALQILYMDKIPDSAAVNESVKLVKKKGCAFASGMVNAVLRKLAANGLCLPDENDRQKYLSIKYSFPEELVKHYTLQYGEEKAEQIMSVSAGRRPIFIRVNTLKTNTQELNEILNNEGVNSVICNSTENCLIVTDTGDITKLPSFKKGLFHVQDLSSQLCCKILGVKPDDTVVDCCAAPGGKTFTSVQYADDTGIFYSADIHPHKIDLIEGGAKRLGIKSVKAVCCDAKKLKNNIHNADKVLCDVPCSGLGVVGRKPEIRYKKLSEFDGLPAQQYEILSSCSQMVKDGGTLVYSTCTLNRLENDEVCDRFLNEHKDFILCEDEEYKSLCSDGKYITVFPSENGGDGFFIAKFYRGQK